MFSKISAVYNTLTQSRVFTTTSKLYGAYCLYHLWESAVSHTLVLDTCRHGTSLKNWTGISFRGFDPSKGGMVDSGGEAALFQMAGKTSRFAENDKGYVYLCNDSKNARILEHGSEHSPLHLLERLAVRSLPRIHACGSTFAQLPKRCGSKEKRMVIAVPLSLFSPTIKVKGIESVSFILLS